MVSLVLIFEAVSVTEAVTTPPVLPAKPLRVATSDEVTASLTSIFRLVFWSTAFLASSDNAVALFINLSRSSFNPVVRTTFLLERSSSILKAATSTASLIVIVSASSASK